MPVHRVSLDRVRTGKRAKELTSHEETIMPQPASRDSSSRQTHPINGGITRASATSVLCFGSRMHAPTPIQSMAIWTAPDGAVYSMVWNFV